MGNIFCVEEKKLVKGIFKFKDGEMQVIKISIALRIAVIKQLYLMICYIFNQPGILHAQDFQWPIHNFIMQISQCISCLFREASPESQSAWPFSHAL